MNQETKLGFEIFKQGNIYKNWKRDSPKEAAAVDSVLAGGAPTTLRSYTGKALMLFAQSKDGFAEFAQGNQGKKYIHDSPGEWSKIQAYRAGGTRPCLGPKPCVTSPTGQGFVHFVAAYKSVILPNPMWQQDIVYTANLSSWHGDLRTAAKNVGFKVVAVLADPVADPGATANLVELGNIRNELRTNGWKIVGWSPCYNDPEAGAQRANNLINGYGFDGWIVNGESWWERENAGLSGRFLSEWNSLHNGKPLALSCLSSDNPNFARSFDYGPWIANRISIQPQVYGNVSPAYTVYNGVQTMKNAQIPETLLNLTFGTYDAGRPIPWDDYKTWKGNRGIYLGERITAQQYSLLVR